MSEHQTPDGGPVAPQGAADPADPGSGDPVTDEVSASEPTGDDGVDAGVGEASVEQLIVTLEAAVAERNDLSDRLMRNQADFENAKRRLARDATDSADRAREDLVERLLPVLDACDSAIQHGATEVEPIFAALLGTLEKEGLARVAGTGEPFDPNVHEAVFHEPAEDGDEGTVVSEVLRPGYTWKGRVIRPAMAKVRG